MTTRWRPGDVVRFTDEGDDLWVVLKVDVSIAALPILQVRPLGGSRVQLDEKRAHKATRCPPSELREVYQRFCNQADDLAALFLQRGRVL